jgi:hypothetical protein
MFVQSFDVVASGQVTGIVQYFAGWSATETAGATAELKIHDSTDNTGKVLARAKFAASQTLGNDFQNVMGLAKRALYVEIVSGALDVQVRGQ